MLVSQKRPRDLGWLHAGPLLFGDWGTSRLYVLGLAFYYVGHATPWYLGGMSLILIAVAWAYTIVCRCFPDGGGVYAAARLLSPTLSVVGATLLLCDYIVTAALSMVEALRYFGMDNAAAITVASVACIAVIGVINWFGAKSAGRFALVIAIAAIITSAVVALMCIPMLGAGFKAITTGHASVGDPFDRWLSLMRIILALSGVEAVANMTGLMKNPVARTAKRTIWPVLGEVVVLNMLFGIALCALPALANINQPDYVTYEVIGKIASDAVPAEVLDYRDHAMKLLAIHSAQQIFGIVAGKAIGITASIIFGLLLISAVNTAVMALVSVQYAMGQDKELPAVTTKLNYSGVPWVGLLVGAAAPAALLVIVGPDVKLLSELYAIGVVGAIAINLVSCAANKDLPIKRWERGGLWGIGIFMTAAELTIMVYKPYATLFAGIMIVAVIGTRIVVRAMVKAQKVDDSLPVPAIGWMGELKEASIQFDASKPRIMLAARGKGQAEYAVDLAARRGATLFAIYIRTLRVLDMRPGSVPRIEDDPQAQEALGTVAVLARQKNVPVVPIYVESPTIVDEILDYTVTYGCDTLIMGKTKRRLFARRLSGDVVAEIAQHLPDGVALITRESA